jgi:hypothetical protein
METLPTLKGEFNIYNTYMMIVVEWIKEINTDDLFLKIDQ